MAVIIDGTAIAEKVRNEVRSGISDLVRERGEAARPSMALILVGNNMVSHNLVRMKARDCEQVGIIPRIIELPEETHEDALLSFIETLNRDDSVNAILCQLPVPQQISTKKLLAAIDTSKDVDGFTARIDADKTDIAACTPAGIMRMLREYDIDVKGKHCVVVGRSNIVGKPMAMQLLLHDATVTVCHSKTQNLSSFTKQADILIVAVGHARLITADMV
ncbi:MAG: bifunctional 5,10-methylenetetrahydrofolate dehydrogenase/5,10-methenyltetrahydrofolate cyclohydrolase, partial [Clostridia bacterium]|nr:bifunctional 5,10-methylenetetrahydrofolate dehydrogenase/5,10-methenyltetrahydrofolate cyclohydrolase [Clostridia bacterium]